MPSHKDYTTPGNSASRRGTPNRHRWTENANHVYREKLKSGPDIVIKNTHTCNKLKLCEGRYVKDSEENLTYPV